MMISGGIPLTALNVAGSVAASQRSDADVDRSKSDAAGRRTQADQTVLASDALADVGEAEMSPDRDPDGMLLYDEGGGGAPEGDEMSGDEPKPPGTARSVDADGVRGRLLDIDA